MELHQLSIHKSWKIKGGTNGVGLCSGESARPPTMWPGFDSGPVPYVGSCLAPRVFLRVLRFSSIHKNQHLQIGQFDQDRERAWKPAKADVISCL